MLVGKEGKKTGTCTTINLGYIQNGCYQADTAQKHLVQDFGGGIYTGGPLLPSPYYIPLSWAV